MHCATNNSNKNTRKYGGWERASIAAQTQSFLCGKFSTAWSEALPNLRHAGVLLMSKIVNLWIKFQEPVTRLGVKLLTRRWAFVLRLGNTGDEFQLARRWCESEKMSCHGILKNQFEPKMDVILTISFKITASYFADEDAYRRIVKYTLICSFIHCHRMRLHCFLLLIARLMRLDHL